MARNKPTGTPRGPVVERLPLDPDAIGEFSVSWLLEPATPHGHDGYQQLLRAGADPLEMRDAANECEHDRLAGDRSAPCGCWTNEQSHAEQRIAALRTRRPVDLPQRSWQERAVQLRQNGRGFDWIARELDRELVEVYKAVKAARKRRRAKAAA